MYSPISDGSMPLFIASDNNQNREINQSFCNISVDLITLKFIWPTLPQNGRFGISHNAMGLTFIHVNYQEKGLC